MLHKVTRQEQPPEGGIFLAEILQLPHYAKRLMGSLKDIEADSTAAQLELKTLFAEPVPEHGQSRTQNSPYAEYLKLVTAVTTNYAKAKPKDIALIGHVESLKFRAGGYSDAQATLCKVSQDMVAFISSKNSLGTYGIGENEYDYMVEFNGRTWVRGFDTTKGEHIYYNCWEKIDRVARNPESARTATLADYMQFIVDVGLQESKYGAPAVMPTHIKATNRSLFDIGNGTQLSAAAAEKCLANNFHAYSHCFWLAHSELMSKAYGFIASQDIYEQRESQVGTDMNEALTKLKTVMVHFDARQANKKTYTWQIVQIDYTSKQRNQIDCVVTPESINVSALRFDTYGQSHEYALEQSEVVQVIRKIIESESTTADLNKRHKRREFARADLAAYAIAAMQNMPHKPHTQVDQQSYMSNLDRQKNLLQGANFKYM